MKIIIALLLAIVAHALSPEDCLVKTSVEGGPLGGQTPIYNGGEITYTKGVPLSS